MSAIGLFQVCKSGAMVC